MSLLPVANRVTRRHNELTQVVDAFASETAAVFLRTAPAREHLVLYALLAMLVLAMLLSAIVKLDRVVVSSGRVVPVGGEIYVSPFDAGIVREVRVKAGDVVKKGQTLALLDPTFTRADRVQLENQAASQEAAMQRIDAELSDRPYRYSTQDPYQALQGGIWEKRQAEYKYNLADFASRIHGIDAQIVQYRSDTTQYRQRLKLAKNVESTYRPLLEKGYVSRLQLMQATDERTEITRLLATAQQQMAALTQNLASLKAQRDAYVQKWKADVGSELVRIRDELQQTRQNLQKAQRLDALSTLDSPSDAVVLKVGKVSSGSIAGSGAATTQDPLFTLVPLDAPVEADVTVNARDIGFIKAGDPVQLKFDAYRFMQHGTARGRIKTISEGSFIIDDNQQPVSPYFKARVTFEEVKLRNVPQNFRLIPGMTLQGDIMIGKRTILSYFIEGSLRTGAEAMREP